MKGFLETYGVAIFTLVLMAILIAMAGPFGVRIKEYMLEKANYTNQIGSEEIGKATNNEDKSDDDVAAMNELYACLYTNGELAISATPIDNSARTDVARDYGKFELKNFDPDIDEFENPYVPWFVDRGKITTVNILNQIKPTTCSEWFNNCYNLAEIKNIENLNTSACTEMVEMFSDCSSLTSLDASNWDTSACTDMSSMFSYCDSLISLDASNWDTSTCIDMSCMFSDCSSLTSLDVSNWKTSACISMLSMFSYCSSLTSLDASNWDTSACTDMSSMFAMSFQFKTLSGHQLSGSCDEKTQYCREHIFDMSNVENCENMFVSGDGEIM